MTATEINNRWVIEIVRDIKDEITAASSGGDDAFDSWTDPMRAGWAWETIRLLTRLNRYKSLADAEIEFLHRHLYGAPNEDLR